MATLESPPELKNDEAPPFESGTVEADGFTVRYEVAGVGDPLVVIHGAGGLNITLGLQLLAESRRVFLLELPGFGDVANERTHTALDMAKTVLAVADALGLEQFDLLGTSMGGVVASWVATEAPGRVRRLVLEAPAAFRVDNDPSKLSPEELLAAFHAHPERKTITAPDPERQARSWPLVEKLVGPLHDEELATRLATLATPALVLFGSVDGLFGTSAGSTYKTLIPSCTFAIVYDAAHDISGDRPEAFASMVGDFLNRGPFFVIENRSTLIYR
jgi:pimeloyl-ACP methyl ester carboxylesterase